MNIIIQIMKSTKWFLIHYCNYQLIYEFSGDELAAIGLSGKFN